MLTKRALLIGCNYPGTKRELRGSVNDVFIMEALLKDVYKFHSDDIIVMVDAGGRECPRPTGSNIRAVLNRMVKNARKGDVCVVFFSGHGAQLPTDRPEELDHLDEAICPCDGGLITDNELRDLTLAWKDGVTFLFLADCCHAGTILDHPRVQLIQDDVGGGNAPQQRDVGSSGSSTSGGGTSQSAGAGKALSSQRTRERRGVRNRSLSFNSLCDLISRERDGAAVDRINVREHIKALLARAASLELRQEVHRWRGLEDRVQELLELLATQLLDLGMWLHCRVSRILDLLPPPPPPRPFWQSLRKPQPQPLSVVWCSQLRRLLTQFRDMLPPPDPELMTQRPPERKSLVVCCAELWRVLVGLLTALASPGGWSGAKYAMPNSMSRKKSLTGPTEPVGEAPPEVGVLISGCLDWQECEEDVDADTGVVCGVFTRSLDSVVRSHKKTSQKPLTNRELVRLVRLWMAERGYAQVPCLECSDKDAKKPFIPQGFALQQRGRR